MSKVFKNDFFRGAGLLLVLAAIGSGAQAATITVNTLDDELNADGDCSLREAVEASNTNAAVDACTAGTPGITGPDTITFTAALAGQTIVLDLFDGDFEDGNASGDLDVLDGNLIIAGPGTGPESIIIDAAGDQVPAEFSPHRAFDVPASASFFTQLELRDLTVRAGRIERSADASGAALNVAPGVGCTVAPAAAPLPCLTLRRVAMAGNEASAFGPTAKGGAVSVVLDINNGIPGSIVIDSSRFNGNDVSSGGNTALGGGMSLELAGGEVSTAPFAIQISNSVFAGNTLSGAGNSFTSGGGLSIRADNLSNIDISDSDFQGNDVSGNLFTLGGGASLDLLSQTPYPLSITNTRIQGNGVSGEMDSVIGGGIQVFASNLSSFDLLGSEVSDNLVSSNGPAFGGGAHFSLGGSNQNAGFSFSMADSRIQNNSLSGNTIVNGGGLFFSASNLDSGQIQNAQISNNLTIHDPGSDGGRALAGGASLALVFSPNSPTQLLSITNSEFSGNGIAHDGGSPGIRPEGQGGGLFIEVTGNDESPGCQLAQPCIALKNSTISGNFVRTTIGNSRAGGLGLEPGVIATANNVTVFDNEVRGLLGFGGGVRLDEGAELTLSNTIIARNLSDGSTDCSTLNATFVSQGFNLVGDASSCLIDPRNGDQLGTAEQPIDPMLDVLAPVGASPTRVHLPLAGSPVLDAGSPDTPTGQDGSCEAADQIATTRPQEGDGDGIPVCDIGAAELAGNLPPAVVNAIEPQTLVLGGQNFTIPLNSVFADPEEGPLSFTAESTTPSTVSASAIDGVLAVSPVGAGEGIVDVTATDDALLSTTIRVLFDVVAGNQNQPPQIISRIQDQNLPVAGAPVAIDLGGIFFDPEGDELFFEAISSNPDVVAVVVDGSTLTLEPGQTGIARVVITAFDSAGQSARIRLKTLSGSPGAASANNQSNGASLGGSGGGGCALLAAQPSRIDPLLWVLASLSLVALFRRKPG